MNSIKDLKNNMASFELNSLKYLYNCAGDLVCNPVPPFCDITKAAELVEISAGWEGAEYAVALRWGVLGVVAEIKLDIQEQVDLQNLIDDLNTVYTKYNGNNGIAIGLLSVEGELWPQLFIPSDVVLGYQKLLNSVKNEFLNVLDKHCFA